MNVTPFTPMKLLRHGDRVDAMLRGERTYPISVEVDLSNTCPHDCAWCSFGTSESQGYRQQNWVQFPTERAERLLEELASCGVKSVTFTGGGEPLVHRAAASLFTACSPLGLQFGVVTNGIGLRGPAADAIATSATFVRVSLDAGTPETHQRTHRTKTAGEFPRILDQLQHVRQKAASVNPDLTIGASFCAQPCNWREIYQAAQLVKEHGGNYLEVRPVFPTDWRGDAWSECLSDDEVEAAKIEIRHAQTHLNDATFQVIGMVERFDQLQDNTKAYRKCRIGPLMTVVGADQNLWHCCVQRGQEAFRVGSLVDKTFQEAWHDALERRMEDRIDLTQCPRCRYDGFNRLIEDGFIRDGLHGNFV